jgi:hypothetical protein
VSLAPSSVLYAMLSYQEFNVWIEIDGVEVPEYAIEVHNLTPTKDMPHEKVMSCWIASERNRVRSYTFRPLLDQ